jgi:uncharacterized protein
MNRNSGSQQPIKTAVITGGHTFEVLDFTQLFRRQQGVDAIFQHLDDFTSSPREIRESYDVVLFYSFMLPTPQDEGVPWYCGKPKTALEELGETNQGIILLHHAILAYPQWPLWDELVGIKNRDQFGFDHDQELELKVADPAHPITHGLQDWQMIDETYAMANAREGSQILLTVDHPKSMGTIAWTRQYKKSRIFCFESGHDHCAYMDPNFQIVLNRAIQWSAGR